MGEEIRGPFSKMGGRAVFLGQTQYFSAPKESQKRHFWDPCYTKNNHRGSHNWVLGNHWPHNQ